MPAPAPRSWPLWLLLAALVGAFFFLPATAVLLGLMTIGVLAVFVGMAWRWWMLLRFIAKWAPQGKDLLLIYSNSPHWQTYIETRWLPKLGHRAVVLNWSERSRWDELHPLEGAIARNWGGHREFNPMALVIRKGLSVRDVRFWQAFRDYKHGKDAELRNAERELGELIGIDLT